MFLVSAFVTGEITFFSPQDYLLYFFNCLVFNCLFLTPEFEVPYLVPDSGLMNRQQYLQHPCSEASLFVLVFLSWHSISYILMIFLCSALSNAALKYSYIIHTEFSLYAWYSFLKAQKAKKEIGLVNSSFSSVYLPTPAIMPASLIARTCLFFFPSSFSQTEFVF